MCAVTRCVKNHAPIVHVDWDAGQDVRECTRFRVQRAIGGEALSAALFLLKRALNEQDLEKLNCEPYIQTTVALVLTGVAAFDLWPDSTCFLLSSVGACSVFVNFRGSLAV